MRGGWLVAGGIGVLAIAYGADRWLEEVQRSIGSWGGTNGWREIGLAVSLLSRLALLAGLGATFVGLRESGSRWAAPAIVAIGAVVALVPPMLLGVNMALPGGLPFVYVTTETAPLWIPTAVFLPWTATGLMVIGVAARIPLRRFGVGASVPPYVPAIVAAGLIAATYPADAAIRSLAIEAAAGTDGYPMLALVAVATRIAVMTAFAVGLAVAIERPPHWMGGVALLAVGAIGFLALPMTELLGPPSILSREDALATVQPGTAGRWMAGATFVVGLVALLLHGRSTVSRERPDSPGVPAPLS